MAHHTHQTDAVYELDHDDPEPGMTWFMTLASAIVLTALVLGLSALYYGVAESFNDRIVLSAPAEQYERLRNEQLSLLATPRRFEIVEADGEPVTRVSIPVTDAMAALVADGIPVPPAAPPAPVAPAAPASPASSTPPPPPEGDAP